MIFVLPWPLGESKRRHICRDARCRGSFVLDYQGGSKSSPWVSHLESNTTTFDTIQCEKRMRYAVWIMTIEWRGEVPWGKGTAIELGTEARNSCQVT